MKTCALLTVIFLISIITAVGQRNMPDIVYLKNGSIIHGLIIEQVPNQTIKIQSTDGNIFVFKFDEIEKITKEPSKISNSENEMKRRIPMAAFGLSLFMPGAGQFYNHQWLKGGIFMGVFIASVASIFTMDQFEHHGATGVYVTGTIAGLTYFTSLFDAPLSSHMINQRNKISDLPKLTFISLNNKGLVWNFGSIISKFPANANNNNLTVLPQLYIGIGLK